MKVLSGKYNKAFYMNHCPTCGKITEMEDIRTGIDGIDRKKCPICKVHIKCIWVNARHEMIELPEHFKMPSDKDIEEFYSSGNYHYYPKH